MTTRIGGLVRRLRSRRSAPGCVREAPGPASRRARSLPREASTCIMGACVPHIHAVYVPPEHMYGMYVPPEHTYVRCVPTHVTYVACTYMHPTYVCCTYVPPAYVLYIYVQHMCAAAEGVVFLLLLP